MRQLNRSNLNIILKWICRMITTSFSTAPYCIQLKRLASKDFMLYNFHLKCFPVKNQNNCTVNDRGDTIPIYKYIIVVEILLYVSLSKFLFMKWKFYNEKRPEVNLS